MKNFLVFTLLILLALSCNGPKDQNPNTTKPNTSTTAPAAKGESLPSLDVSILKKLYDQADFLDYIYYDLPFSMSQNDAASIQSSLGNLSPNPVGVIPAGCKPIARAMYQIKGEIVEEFNVYYSDNCQFIVHMKNEKPVAANMMSAAGIDFYKKIIAQAYQNRQ